MNTKDHWEKPIFSVIDLTTKVENFSICYKDQHEEANQTIHYRFVLLCEKFGDRVNAWFDRYTNQNTYCCTFNIKNNTITDFMEDDNDEIF